MYAPAAALQQSLNRRLQRQQMEQSAQNVDQNMALSLLTQGQAAQQGDQQRDAMLERVRQSNATAALRAQLEADAREAAAKQAGDARARAAELMLEGVLDRNKTARRNNQDTNDTRVLLGEMQNERAGKTEETRASARVRAAYAPRGGAQPPVRPTPNLLGLQTRIKNAERAAGQAERAAAALIKDGNILPGQEAAYQMLTEQGAAHRSMADQLSTELRGMSPSDAYTNMGNPAGRAPASAPKLSVQESPEMKAERLLRAAEAGGDPMEIQFAKDYYQRVKSGR